MQTGCYAKYANDAEGLSSSNFKNNAKITLDDDNNVCIKASKKIKAGEEIFCSYGKRYWEKHS
jgi:SET domain-containing protein